MNRSSTPSLFSRGHRPSTLPRAHQESRYSFLNRAADAPWELLRQTLDQWFCRLPADARREVHERFASEDDLSHLGAFWEMWVHEAHVRLGWRMTVHVGTDPGARQQDFEAERDGERVWIEATVVAGDALVHRVDQKRHAQICDLIDTVYAPSFWLGLEVLSYGTTTPGRKQVVDPIERWLAGVDPEDLRVRQEQHPDQTRELAFDGWRIRLDAIAVNGQPRDDRSRLVMQSHGVTRLNNLGPLRRKIKKKAGHYEQTRSPYLLAVLALGDAVDNLDIGDALLGTSQIQIGPSSDHREVRVRDGVWVGPRGPQNRSLSGVLIARQLQPAGIARVLPMLVLNPWASRPMRNVPPWHTIQWDDRGNETISPARVEPWQLFDLSPDWPGP